MHQSFATINSPEFINLEPLDINPLMSSCEIKVFYLGESRNRTFIDKETAREMAKTLRGAPIVGHFREEDEDFTDHGEEVIINDKGIQFKCLTKPYGFVSPDAKVWFQKFNDLDEFGNSIEREYLMTTGFLWTGQFPECQVAVEDEGRPHSMELDKNSLEGHWAENYKNGMDFFIINDATFSKLCILGESTEPCFEGSKVSAPELSTSFSLDDNFKNTLFTMMQDLKTVLEGGCKEMDNLKTISVESEDKVNETFTAENENETEKVVESEFVASKKDDEEEEKKESSESKESENKEEDDDKKKKSNFKKDDDEDEEEKEDSEEKDSSENKEEDDEDDKKKKQPPTKSELEEQPAEDFETKYTALVAEYETLQVQFSELEQRVQSLQAFKNEIENKEKDELIKSFYMLSDDDKKDVIANKEKFTYDEIKKELSVICFDKKVSFAEVKEEVVETPAVTFNVPEDNNANLPEWVCNVKKIQSNI